MTGPLRVGTRGSPLALRQTALVIRALRRPLGERAVETVEIRTQGDRDPRRTTDIDFTAAIDRALEKGRIDIAVHSAKDLPARPPRGLRLAAVLPRADPRDCLVLRSAAGLDTLPSGAVIGSSSSRRRAELLRARPDLAVVNVRGNVDTRLELVRTGRVDGAILARSGLSRLGRLDAVSEILDPRRFVPAPGQGALAVTARKHDRTVGRLLAQIDHSPSHLAVRAERALVEALGGNCDAPLGAWARCRGDRLTLRAVVLSRDGRRAVEATLAASCSTPRALGRAVARRLLRGGAGALLPPRPGREGRP